MPAPISHYCQKCLAPNPLGQDFCARCGTRLMIVVETTSARYEVTDQSVPTDEHLLERISIVENRLSRLTERLERSLDLLLRQAQNSYFDRSLVKTLIGLLTDDGLIESHRLEQLWNERCQNDAKEQQENSRREELRLKILAAPPVREPQEFIALVGEGFLALDDHRTAVGIDKLERAAEMTDSNPALHLFIGEHYFRTGKPELARTYLSRAHDASPDDVRVSLLLGLACADEGDCEVAKKLLVNVIDRGGSCFAGHYGLGWLHLSENKPRKALAEFKRALEVHPSPEAHYVLGCLYYQLERDVDATKHLLKAIELDKEYRDAFHLLALVYNRTGQIDLAEEALQKSTAAVAPDSSARRKTKKTASPNRLPLFAHRDSLNVRLMTGTNQRIAEALKTDALNAFTQTKR